MTPGFCILHANRLEDLRTLLVEWLREHPLAPLEEEVVLIQNRGMAQWLKLALAEPEGHGIAASLDPTLPARFLWDAYRAVLGEDRVPAESPYSKEALSWRLMQLLPGPLGAQLDAADALSRYRMACRIADLFDQYQVYRADWLNDWADGRDTAAAGFPWQPALWRTLVAHIGAGSSRAALHQAFLDGLANAKNAPAGLPRRIVIFGISSLPQQFIEALAALGKHCQVLLFVNNPCQHFWADIVEDRQFAGGSGQTRHAIKSNQTNPLLASWGKQGRDYIGLLYGYDQPERYQGNFQQIDLFTAPGGDSSSSLLHRIQHSIFDLEKTLPPGAPDASLKFQTAHNPQREVEILQDHLLGLFEADPTLQPRDVVVMMPDIERYAPHIEAVFGRIPAEDARYLPFTIADQRQRVEDPLLRALDWLLQLPESRVGMSEVLNLLDVAAVRKRFGIRDTDIPQLQSWLNAAGVRWGLHGEQRKTLGLPDDFQQNTWRAGLRRMLLGYANGSAGPWQDIEPLDEVGGLSAALAGPLVDLLDALDAAWRTLSTPATPVEWETRLRTLLSDFFLAEDADSLLTMIRLEQALDVWLQHCVAAGLEEALPVAIVRDAWVGAVDDAGRSPRFLYGRMNFCTLMPMRAIPFRVVCVLGMNDREFPRSRIPQDFDLMAADYRPGDRSRREDDRYQFLEALLAARDHLYISWIGRNVRDNSPLAPSVLVAQLRDFIGEADAARLTTEHPLQPFSDRYFDDTHTHLATYAADWVPGDKPPEHGEASVTLRLPEMPLDLHHLVRFLRQPVDYFFAERLGITAPAEMEVVPDHEPFAFDALESYALNRRLLDAALLAGTPEPEAARLLREGALPPGWPGTTLLQDSAAAIGTVLSALSERALQPTSETLELSIKLDIGAISVEIADIVRDLYRNDGGLTRVRFAPTKIKGKPYRLLEPWVVHVLCHAADRHIDTLFIAPDSTVTFPPLDGAHARAIATGWMTLWAEALTTPLPIACKTGLISLTNPEKAASWYEGGYNSSGERGESLWLARSWPTFAELSDSGRFESLAEALYRPLLEAIDGQT